MYGAYFGFSSMPFSSTPGKIVVAGDTTQIDLPLNTRSGFSDALTRLSNIKGCARVTLDKADIVRHRLVQDIVKAYEDTADDRDRRRRKQGKR